jgi:hypothetical protein
VEPAASSTRLSCATCRRCCRPVRPRAAGQTSAGRWPDLDHAASSLEEVAVPEGHAERLRWLTERCDVLRLKFVRDNDQLVLTAAIEAAREAIRVCPQDHEDRPSVLSAAANALQAAAASSADQALASEAMAAARQAVELSSPGDGNRPRLLNNLGHTLISRVAI